MRSCFTICLAVIALCSAANAASVSSVTSFGSNPGALAMYEYVPDNLPADRPIVVVLHGCTQQAAAMESAGWNALADAHAFTVIYPEQTTANNPVRCFNWAGEYGDTANLERGKGENQSIISMIDTVIAAHGGDPKRVFIVGFSAGGAFVPVMLATWPDRFAAGAVMSGIPYRCATSVGGAFSCQSPGVAKTSKQWGDLVRAAASVGGTYPRVQIWQGSADTTVKPMNADELVKQWTDVHGTDTTADATDMIGPAMRSQYKVGSQVVVESYVVSGMGHAIAIGGEGSAACPATAAAYFTDVKVCSTVRAAEFFGLMSPGSGGSDGSGGGGSDGGGGGGGDDEPGGNKDLPGCGLDAGGGGCGTGMLFVLVVVALRRRRR